MICSFLKQIYLANFISTIVHLILGVLLMCYLYIIFFDFAILIVSKTISFQQAKFYY